MILRDEKDFCNPNALLGFYRGLDLLDVISEVVAYCVLVCARFCVGKININSPSIIVI